MGNGTRQAAGGSLCVGIKSGYEYGPWGTREVEGKVT